MPGVDGTYLSSASPPSPKRQLHADLAHCSDLNYTQHCWKNTIGDIYTAQARTISGGSMCSYEGRTTSFLPRRLEREPTVKCCLQGYLQVIPKRLLKLLLRSRWLSIKKVQVFNPEEYGPIDLSIFHENVQCCLPNDLLTKHLQVTFAFPTLQSAACRCLRGERQRCYTVYHTVMLAVENHFYTHRKKIPKWK